MRLRTPEFIEPHTRRAVRAWCRLRPQVNTEAKLKDRQAHRPVVSERSTKETRRWQKCNWQRALSAMPGCLVLLSNWSACYVFQHRPGNNNQRGQRQGLAKLVLFAGHCPPAALWWELRPSAQTPDTRHFRPSTVQQHGTCFFPSRCRWNSSRLFTRGTFQRSIRLQSQRCCLPRKIEWTIAFANSTAT